MKKRTVSVRLDPDDASKLERAASLTRQSQGAFLEKAGIERAHRILLDWAVERYRSGEGSLSQLADKTGLGVEEIMVALGDQDREAALEMFLASCKTIAETQNNPEFLRLAQEAVAAIDSARAA
ncbi:MAG: hypothetical protein ACOX87_09015 [Chloroflexota bacterium]|jgi:hypothetical protein